MLARCGMRNLIGLKLNDSVANDVHGPSQLLRAARVPSCVDRHSRALLDPEARRALMPSASAGSTAAAGDDGSQTKARSFALPSPLMSPATIGVKRVPERNWPNQLTRRK